MSVAKLKAGQYILCWKKPGSSITHESEAVYDSQAEALEWRERMLFHYPEWKVWVANERSGQGRSL